MASKRPLEGMGFMERIAHLKRFREVMDRAQKAPPGPPKPPPGPPKPPPGDAFTSISYTLFGTSANSAKYASVHPAMPSLLCPDKPGHAPKVLWKMLSDEEYAAFACLNKNHLDDTIKSGGVGGEVIQQSLKGNIHFQYHSLYFTVNALQDQTLTPFLASSVMVTRRPLMRERGNAIFQPFARRGKKELVLLRRVCKRCCERRPP